MLNGVTAPQANKAVVRRLIDEVLNAGHQDFLDELYTPPMARAAQRWIKPFRVAFPDLRMQIIELIARR